MPVLERRGDQWPPLGLREITDVPDEMTDVPLAVDIEIDVPLLTVPLVPPAAPRISSLVSRRTVSALNESFFGVFFMPGQRRWGEMFPALSSRLYVRRFTMIARDLPSIVYSSRSIPSSTDRSCASNPSTTPPIRTRSRPIAIHSSSANVARDMATS